ncbi:hypothetical protein Ancab_035656 [Ancistrocladus abbreviatus]
MATSAFKSTTKRASIGGTPTISGDHSSTSTNRNNPATHRRSRSVSRFSHRIPNESSADYGETPVRSGKFVNTVRGSGFPEISLDDLAIEMFSSSELSSQERSSELLRDRTASQRRGRSASRRPSSGVGEGKISGGDGGLSGGGRVVSDASARRRRSLSVVRYQVSDSESNSHPETYTSHGKHKNFSGGNIQKLLAQRPSGSSQQRGLRRSSSQRDLLKSHDNYSSYSSTLTEDEARDTHGADGMEKTIQAVYAKKKFQSEHPSDDDVNNNVYQTMRKELRHAVEEIRIELEQGRVNRNPSEIVMDGGPQPKDSGILQAVSTVRSYTTKLEQSEKRKKELLAEILLEEQRGKELERIVGKMLPDQKNSAVVKRSTRSRKKSNDRKRISKQLIDEAEKIIEDFISSVEDTDLSSFDGERSDTSSTFGVTTKSKDALMNSGEIESFRSSTRSDSLPVEMDGVLFPWLQWETTNDGSPLPCRDKQHLATPKVLPRDVFEEASAAQHQEQSTHSKSSHGSWSPGVVDGFSIELDEASRTGEPNSHKNHILSSVPRKTQVDIDAYLKCPSNEDFLFEIWKNRKRISGGGLLLCQRSLGTVL